MWHIVFGNNIVLILYQYLTEEILLFKNNIDTLFTKSKDKFLELFRNRICGKFYAINDRKICELYKRKRTF